ncbi:MAG: helix-turn-helix transcriptional regulator [Thermovirgaceae bacterium]|nr:helix-turn-helix transcriptional regulator [Synergistales bacterium]HPC76279.1 helix-turn-helix transcriptional regulator [Synergistales bacterium]HRU91123.1 helix-turn-helix transcriptional regulator [Thermovirgaceae bacterium]
MSLGLRIKTLRRSKGLTQKRLSEMVYVSRIYIQSLESNRRLPSMKLLKRLAAALDVEVVDLVHDPGRDGSGRLMLEEVLNDSEPVEIWYRSRKLSRGEVQLVQKLIEAALSDWDRENA